MSACINQSINACVEVVVLMACLGSHKAHGKLRGSVSAKFCNTLFVVSCVPEVCCFPLRFC